MIFMSVLQVASTAGELCLYSGGRHGGAALATSGLMGWSQACCIVDIELVSFPVPVLGMLR